MSENVSYVGMDLDANGGSVVNAIISAVQADNEGVIVDDYTVFKKVKCPTKMVVNRNTVEDELGADFSMQKLHIYMSSVFGFITEWDDEMLIIEWEEK